MTRRTVVAGNWKMHLGPGEVAGFFEDLAHELDGGALERPGLDVLVFPPTLSVPAALEAPSRPPSIGVGVQNVHWEDEGAFTGEISVPMALQAGATHVLVGHSERRHLFGETDDEVGRKVKAVVRHDLTPVICVGETLEQRRAGRLDEVLVRQLDGALAGLDEVGADVDRILLAYEPVWAIGTGETATPDDASEAHGILRAHLEKGGHESGVPVLYGGSVKPHNVGDLLAADGVDGVLVGGASLQPDSFARLIEAGAAAAAAAGR